jgi:phosphopantetheinyl transferase (holo-ACP synthase)
MLLAIAMTTIFASLHMRMHFFMQTMREREEYLKLRCATNGLMTCAVDKACKQYKRLLASTQQYEQLAWPLDATVQAQASIQYQRHEMPDGQQLKISVSLTHNQRVCTAHAMLHALYDARGKLLYYTMSEWTIG